MPSVTLASALIGFVSGLRAMTGVAAVTWAARLRAVHLEDTGLAFLGYAATPYVATALALAEGVADKLPGTPSRTIPASFGTRLATAGFAGAALGRSAGEPVTGLVTALAGCVAGTLGGFRARAALAEALGDDLPAALIEDAVTVGLAALAVRLARR